MKTTLVTSGWPRRGWAPPRSSGAGSAAPPYPCTPPWGRKETLLLLQCATIVTSLSLQRQTL